MSAMSKTMQQRAPRPNDDAWALAIGVGVVALALFGLAARNHSAGPPDSRNG